MKTFSLSQWTDYIQSLHSRTIDLTLDRVESVYKRLAIDFSDSLVITLGGTNGKGSSQAMLESIYRHQGCLTATYSSPHLVDYNERIKINNVPVSDDIICQAFYQIEQVRGSVTLTYFEYGSLAAFWIFANAEKLKLTSTGIDVIVLETGMGGRQDAVNVIQPDAVLITNIGLDHVQWLGNDRESIAYEKAGLFKKDTIAVCNDFSPPNAISRVAKDVGSPLYLVNRDYFFGIDDDSNTWHWQGSSDQRLDKIPLPNIPGECQIQNAAAVLTVVQLLCNKIRVLDKSIKQGLSQVLLAGRLQKMTFLGKHLLLDVAHNAESFMQLQQYLLKNPIQGRNKAVFGMLSDKDIKSSMEKVVQHVDQWFLCSIEGERSGDANCLAKIILDHDKGANIHNYINPESAFREAIEKTDLDDRLIVMGSFHTVGDVLKYIKGLNRG